MKRLTELKSSDMDLVSKTIDVMVAEAIFCDVRVLPVLRDALVIKLLCATGLRVSEALALNVDSIIQDPDKPELCDCGMMLVGSRQRPVGSGFRTRPVQVMDKELSDMIDYYICEVRPSLLQKHGEKALFVSQKGARLSNAAVVRRFRDILDKAGLDGEGFTLRSVRHACINRMSRTMSWGDYSKQFGFRCARLAPMTVSLNILQRGHRLPATTALYIHPSDIKTNKLMPEIAMEKTKPEKTKKETVKKKTVKKEESSYREILSQKDCELFDHVMTAYESMRLGAKHYALSYVKRDSQVITNLVCFTKLPPWRWTEELFLDWRDNLVSRDLTIATRRSYTFSIKRFLNFLCSRYNVKQEIKRVTGFTPHQIVGDIDVYGRH